MMLKRNILIAATVVVASAGSYGTALTGVALADGSAPVLVPDVLQPLPDPVAAVDTTTTKAFAAFRNLPATKMPADVAAAVGSPTRYGRNPALARSINTVTGKGWLIPGRGYVCIAVPDPVDGWGSNCVPTAQAATEGVQIYLEGPAIGNAVAVTAVAPTGTTTVASTATKSTDLSASNGVASAVVSTDATVSVEQ